MERFMLANVYVYIFDGAGRENVHGCGTKARKRAAAKAEH
jgi:hypothetical protein